MAASVLCPSILPSERRRCLEISLQRCYRLDISLTYFELPGRRRGRSQLSGGLLLEVQSSVLCSDRTTAACDCSRRKQGTSNRKLSPNEHRCRGGVGKSGGVLSKNTTVRAQRAEHANPCGAEERVARFSAARQFINNYECVTYTHNICSPMQQMRQISILSAFMPGLSGGRGSRTEG